MYFVNFGNRSFKQVLTAWYSYAHDFVKVNRLTGLKRNTDVGKITLKCKCLEVEGLSLVGLFFINK